MSDLHLFLTSLSITKYDFFLNLKQKNYHNIPIFISFVICSTDLLEFFIHVYYFFFPKSHSYSNIFIFSHKEEHYGWIDSTNRISITLSDLMLIKDFYN